MTTANTGSDAKPGATAAIRLSRMLQSTPKCREPKGSIKHAENQKVALHGWRRDVYGSWRRRTAGGAGFAATESRRYLSKHETYLGKQIKR